MTVGIPEIDSGSFRDPEGAVIQFDGRIFRGLGEAAHRQLSTIAESNVLNPFEKSGRVVSTTFLAPASSLSQELKKRFPQFSFFAEHPTIPVVSYPCEWTHAMLCDAAILQLELQDALLDRGFSLKDASAYNVQFRDTQETFIDVLSFEKLTSVVWPAYGQFCRMFLYPLLLRHYRFLPTKPLFLTFMDGLSLADTYRQLGFVTSLRPTCFLDVFLPYFLEKRHHRSSGSQPIQRSVNETTASSLQMNVRRLKRLLQRLRGLQHSGPSLWSDYEKTNSYTEQQMNEKKAAFRIFLDQANPTSLVDLGCNTGEFSVMAASTRTRVVAVDADHDSVDRLYRKARAESLRIQTLWMDFSNPTPNFGFNSTERRNFSSRVKSDAVVALALVHHLFVTAGIPLKRISEFFWSLSSRHLMIEYVAPADPQFQSLIGFKNRQFEEVNETVFEKIFGEGAALVKKTIVTPHRTLFHFVKNS